MKRIGILGAGPAALVAAMLLHREGYLIELFGVSRRANSVEGISWRTVDGIRKAGFSEIDGQLGERWKRISAWNGKIVIANGEHVIQRHEFDKALLDSVIKAGIVVHHTPVYDPKFYGHYWHLDLFGEGEKKLKEPLNFDYIVDARGASAGKVFDNDAEGVISVALVRHFISATKIPGNVTYSEPFRKGWAWATHSKDGSGTIQIVVSPHTVKQERSDIGMLHFELYKQLSLIQNELGPALKFEGGPMARGIHPALRSCRVAARYIRIGDACYSSDPLSGHGIFEAVSGAYAALPVINTCLRRPECATLAIEYYNSRAREIFASRMKTAKEFYMAETRWPKESFWHERQHIQSLSSIESEGQDQNQPNRFTAMPVVENGYIVERNVAMKPGYPRGVRFVDGVDLYALAESIRNDKPIKNPADLAISLGVSTASILKAWSWLLLHSFVEEAPPNWEQT